MGDFKRLYEWCIVCSQSAEHYSFIAVQSQQVPFPLTPSTVRSRRDKTTEAEKQADRREVEIHLPRQGVAVREPPVQWNKCGLEEYEEFASNWKFGNTLW